MWAITVRRSLKLITFALFSTSFSFSLHQQPSCGVLRRREERSLSKTRLQVLPSSQSLEGLVLIYIVAPWIHSFRMWWTRMDETTCVWEMNWSNSSRYLLICTISHALSILSSCHLIHIPRICRAFDINPLFISLISICSHLIQVMGQSTQQQATLTHPAYYTQVLT